MQPAGSTRPHFMTPEVERVLDVALRIAQELAVARARIDTLERLLERKGLISRAEIEGFAPTEAELAERSAWNQEYIARVLRVLEQEAASMADRPRDAAP